jgi:dipeptidyl aminopeptidase/acylaminoacyl peptidase
MSQTAPFGTWTSPVTAQSLAGTVLGLRHPWRHGNSVYWLESRAAEGGRTVPVRRRPDGRLEDLLAAPWDIRGRVHEYGGGDCLFIADDGQGQPALVFCNAADQAVCRVGLDDPAAVRALTRPGRDRFADFVHDRKRRRLVCVRERHGDTGEPANTLVALPLDSPGTGDNGTVLVQGNDFVAAPRLSPDGQRLAWLTWNHPDMPWDRADLMLADFAADGSLGPAIRIAGGEGEAAAQPVWLADGRLAYVSDRDGWWNLYLWDGRASRPLCPMPAEFARPAWVFGQSEVTALADGRLAAAFTRDGLWRLGLLNVDSGAFDVLELPYTVIGELNADAGHLVFCAAGPARPNAVVSLALAGDLAKGKLVLDTVRASSPPPPDPAAVSVARPIRFPTTDGQTACAFHYPPTNPAFRAPEGERPPLIVRSHGGPTAASESAWSPRVQFWTSRGFAVVEVNYRGSTGYGRAYRDALKGCWGVADVDDCVAAARHLVGQGLADPARLIIAGSSAGGYTTLAALTFHDVFRAGASHYGIGDLEALARDTHKFEARYLDRLVGPWPERRDLYVARSPIHHVDRLSAPMVFFQGLEDKVVPPDQAERMVAAIDAKGLPVAYVAFPGERHGFRKAETIAAALDGELYFYGRVFGFSPAGPPAAIPIRNLAIEPA